MPSLTTKAVDAAKPRAKPCTLFDAAGLYLYVATTGLRSWRANHRADDKQQTQTYGSYPKFSLAQARKAQALAKDGQSEPAPKRSPTFRTVAEQWLEHHVPTLKNAKERIQISV